MSRWLLILLLTFLPFQFSWAAVAGYCQHETGVAAQHFGHHAHQHQSGETASEAEATVAADAKVLSNGVDNDCLACHAGCATALISVTALPLVATTFVKHPWYVGALTAPPTVQPERPNWFVPV